MTLMKVTLIKKSLFEYFYLISFISQIVDFRAKKLLYVRFPASFLDFDLTPKPNSIKFNKNLTQIKVKSVNQ